ncbi:Leucine rich repeat C-terminal domain [Halocaridina rubra]|uniref:Leucine rich repeat C-terminal domain n=1 Tax=Halocaridina rubra TaxID=373956 RepID=A0AAN8WRY0_HALRR
MDARELEHALPILTTSLTSSVVADCRNAGFTTIPTKLSPEIQELNLAGNRIEYLEKDAFKTAGLVNLQKLYLGENNISSLHKDAFRDLKILIELNLAQNHIDKLHPHTFTGMEKLRLLDLSSNELSRLDGIQFPVLPHLRKLFFTDNQISYINNYAFINLILLESLRLSGNRLKLVQPDLFANNSQLFELELHSNPWECNCRLKELLHWVKLKSLLQEHVSCFSPERMSGRKWESIFESELACLPKLTLPQTEVPVVPGQNASLTCQAMGDPLPQIKWILNGRVLTNMSVMPFSKTEQRYILNEVVEGGERWLHLTIIHVADHDLTYYTCVADNLAGLVEQNVSLVAAASTLSGPITPKSNHEVYIIIAIATGGLISLTVVIAFICCCCRKRQRGKSKPTVKVNGVASGSHTGHRNDMVVNSMEKPSRKYEQVPQNDSELMKLTSNPGSHRSYDEVDYPESGPMTRRKAMTTLEEGRDNDLQRQDTTLPLEFSTASHSIIADYIGHYPDLIDMTRTKAVSPTDLSYRSLGPSQYTLPSKGRYSYIHPADYGHYPVAYVQAQPRPGYVTLPRKHRLPSWNGQTFTEHEALLNAQDDMKPHIIDPFYDTLGPRTTADGTSRTDLTRPALRAVELYTPPAPQSSNFPPSLPSYCTPVRYNSQSSHLHLRNQSSTLPRSTPNMLDCGGSLSLPFHETLQGQIPQSSPTPSNASTVPTASPYHGTNNTSHSSNYSKLNNHGNPSNMTHIESRNELLPNSLKHKNIENLNGEMNANTSDSGPDTFPAPTLTVLSGKKVPPKPPPKPSVAKRLSLSSIGDSRKSSVIGDSSRVFQDEGPDGTEI